MMQYYLYFGKGTDETGSMLSMSNDDVSLCAIVMNRRSLLAVKMGMDQRLMLMHERSGSLTVSTFLQADYYTYRSYKKQRE